MEKELRARIIEAELQLVTAEADKAEQEVSRAVEDMLISLKSLISKTEGLGPESAARTLMLELGSLSTNRLHKALDTLSEIKVKMETLERVKSL